MIKETWWWFDGGGVSLGHLSHFLRIAKGGVFSA
jgi:hypothetical protein